MGEADYPQASRPPGLKRPPTGTEWEFFDAMNVAEKKDAPVVLTFRCTLEQTIATDDDEELDRLIWQRRQVNGFFKRFQDDQGGQRWSFIGYKSLEDLAEKQDGQLRATIKLLTQPDKQAIKYGAADEDDTNSIDKTIPQEPTAMDPLPLICRRIDQAHADGAEHLDLSFRKLGRRRLILPDLLAALDLNGDSKLPTLRSLDLSDHGLDSLPRELERLAELAYLNICGNPIQRLPDIELPPLIIDTEQWRQLRAQFERRALFGLEILPEGLHGNIDFFSEVDRRGIVWLRVTRGLQGQIPDALYRLERLTHLDLSNNQLPELSESIGQLQQLIHLDLGGNRLSKLPKSIVQLQQLTNLDLRHNQLLKLPESIGQLRRLTHLDLTDNRLSELPDGIGNLDNLHDLGLHDNPLSGPLAAAVRSGPDAVLEYLRTRGTRLYGAKLLIVGEAGAGKTSLAWKLLDPVAPLLGEGESTLGINVYRDWRFPYTAGPQASDQTTGEQTQMMSANIWDFGGQEIQYTTHQFFLTLNALYVLVADARRQETDYDYWFKIIRLLGRDQAPADGAHARKTPVLVLLHEKANRQVTDFSLGVYRQRFPELAIETAEADLANLADGRVENLRMRVQRTLSALPYVGERQPAAWRSMQAAVENLRVERHLSFRQFHTLCTAYGIHQEQAARVLLRYLNFVGICVYFDRDPLLKDFIITDPQWAVNALYRVLDRDEVQDQKGRLRRRFFYEVLAAEGYREYEIDRLFRLLLKDQFEICFPLEGSDGELHIVSQLIPTAMPVMSGRTGTTSVSSINIPSCPRACWHA